MKVTIRHGEKAGYEMHKARGIPVCQDCRDANARYMRSLRLRKGETSSVLVPVEVLVGSALKARDLLAFIPVTEHRRVWALPWAEAVKANA